MRRFMTATAAFVMLGLLAGCAAAPASQPPPERPAPTSPPTAIASWSSSEPGEPKLALYDDGTLGGFDGCNAFGGTYVRTDDLLELHLGYGTLKACIGVDLWLRNASSAAIVDDSLLLYDADGKELGTLTAQ